MNWVGGVTVVRCAPDAHVGRLYIALGKEDKDARWLRGDPERG